MVNKLDDLELIIVKGTLGMSSVEEFGNTMMMESMITRPDTHGASTLIRPHFRLTRDTRQHQRVLTNPTRALIILSHRPETHRTPLLHRHLRSHRTHPFLFLPSSWLFEE